MKPGTARGGQQKTDAATKLGASCYLEPSRIGTSAWLVLIGELDLSCSKRFKAALAESMADGPTDLVLDLRSVTFIDSTGIGLLLKADTLAREEGARLHIVRSRTEIVTAVFEASGINSMLPLVDDAPRL